MGVQVRVGDLAEAGDAPVLEPVGEALEVSAIGNDGAGGGPWDTREEAGVSGVLVVEHQPGQELDRTPEGGAYPVVAQHESYVIGAAELPNCVRYDHGGGQLSMNWLMPEGVGTGLDGMATMAERQAHLRAMTRRYAEGRYFLPVLGSMQRELHPLMAWWAVQYALSMLCRYQPAGDERVQRADGVGRGRVLLLEQRHLLHHRRGVGVECPADGTPRLPALEGVRTAGGRQPDQGGEHPPSTCARRTARR
jgi:hypothetical protein